MLLVVLYGYQGADIDAEQLILAEQLFDATLVELGVVARGQPCMLVKGISAGSGLIWMLFGVESSLLLHVGVLGSRLVVIVGILWLVALLRLLLFPLSGWNLTGGLHLSVRAHFDCVRLILSLFNVPLSGLLLGCLLLMRVEVLSRLRSRGSGRCMMMACSSWPGLMLEESLRVGDVSRAWLAWCLPVPVRGFVVGGGTARFRVVRLGGPEVGLVAMSLMPVMRDVFDISGLFHSTLTRPWA